jgi:DNA invertase Pin-like site-specific DNA recombinase
MLLGYARVSTGAQSLEAQMAALKAAGCEKTHAEKRSGAETDRKALAKLMAEASPGDTIVVTRLDRLARSTAGSAEPAGSARQGRHLARMVEGRKRARAGGVKFGPKFKLNHFQRQEALARLAAGESQAAVAQTAVDRATISRLQRTN